ncbi:MAG TPA: hypothetical protein VG934_02415 [Candidatus Paceibacterota bacterium]|nr:hypothetical protein [Candidatus Paceibacterota bacterium]
MSFSVDVVNLILYCVQQLGVMMGVGGETIILIVYFLSARDGVIEPKEEQFGRAVHKVLGWGLWLMIASGAAITLLHIFSGASDIVLEPAFLFKWLLIGGVAAAELGQWGRPFANYWWEGSVASQWYALFLLHILAPIATWGDLIFLYVIWNIGFIASFVAVVHMLHLPHVGARKHTAAPVEHKPQHKAAPPLAVHKPLPVVKKAPPPALKPIAAPAMKREMPPPPAPKPVVVVELPKPQPIVAPPQPKVEIPAPVPPLPSKPIPPPIPQKPEQIAPPAPQKPRDEPMVPRKPADPSAPPPSNLPAIRVMPRSQADMESQLRAAAV